ncbi:sulfate ABC transporter permease subunit CysT [Bordetella genomosp. 9]|uniref:Sulfate transport system permease protein CysT n=1 Tax=Bordetella genomosp. 9 TaxID=1416803 RepID=A0A1W6YY06_9BORD|nr:sulfate ABC transporter permease subunit CysT [Bordetella genomosp. 9]ARP85977.1 sulfate ABC transporter permease subunit CysT [Bordetella genomosp. 9]
MPSSGGGPALRGLAAPGVQTRQHAGLGVVASVLPGRRKGRTPRVLPGLNLTLGYTLFYLGALVLLPLSALVIKAAGLSWDAFVAAVTSPRVLSAYRITFGAALIAAVVNLFFGLLVAWVLVRHSFPGKRVLDALVDLPFALPTAVAGISLAALLGPHGWIGQWLAPLGIKIAYTPAGIVVALIFIGIPFVVRTVQPVLEDLEKSLEEAAASLGARPVQIFLRVLLPAIAPALLTGFAMAFARAVGEYGSVIFIAGNMPMVSEIAPLLILVKLEQFDYAGAAAIGSVLLGLSFLMLLAINGLQAWQRRAHGGEA